jgi:hypothetical protein
MAWFSWRIVRSYSYDGREPGRGPGRQFRACVGTIHAHAKRGDGGAGNGADN